MTIKIGTVRVEMFARIGADDNEPAPLGWVPLGSVDAPLVARPDAEEFAPAFLVDLADARGRLAYVAELARAVFGNPLAGRHSIDSAAPPGP